MIQELTNNQNRYNKCSSCSTSERGLSAVSWSKDNVQIEQILCETCLNVLTSNKN